MINRNHIFFKLSKDVAAIALPLTRYLNIHYFSFKRTYKDGSKIYLFTDENLYKHWFEKKYYLIGNKEANHTDYKDSYDLWEYLPDPYKLYEEGAKLFNVAHGLTITRQHEDYCDFFFFATNVNNSSIKKVYIDRKDVFEKFCNYFLEVGQNLIQQAEGSKLILPLSNTIKTLEPDLNIDGFLKNIYHSKEGLKLLTEREIECAFYLSQGKSYKEIARIYEISPRTIEEHSYNIRKKLGCKTKSELISLLSKKLM
jgi:DNA-binding CsgD family transcriptional regulator